MNFRPKKYVCSICNKGFRRQKQHYNHVNRAHKFTSNQGINKKQIQQIIIEPELVSLKPEIIHSEPRTTEYFGREYNFNPICTGNRHLRSGVAFATDPLRRTLTKVIYEQNMESIGPLPRLNPNLRCAI